MRSLKEFEDSFLRELVQRNLISNEERAVLTKSKIINKTPILKAISKNENISENEILETLSSIYNAKIPISKEQIKVSQSIEADNILEKYNALLGEKLDGQNIIYMFEPVINLYQNEIKEQIGEYQKYVISGQEFEKLKEDLIKGSDFRKNCLLINNEELENMPEEQRAIFFANELLEKSIKINASDIHIEPEKEGFRVRMRLNGMLQIFGSYELKFYPGISSRLKLIANLDIAEKRETQDGAIVQKSENGDVSFRVSVMPTIYGEKIVLRKLNSGEQMIMLKELNMPKQILDLWRRSIKKPYGIILVSGPTGSGKSTTLFAAINEINKPEINIVTVEDPVEFRIKGANQVQINSYKVSFADALRSILRQDPDVVMIGEIRDQETAEIALRASLTGHLVFSTIHTNDAPSSVTRLVDMGIEPFLVASSVVGVLAQRLVRVLCDECKQEHILDESSAKLMNVALKTKVYKSCGCPACNGSGYVARRGVYEFLLIDDMVRVMINNRANDVEIKNYAKENLQMQTIFESAKALMLEGITSYDEVLRVSSE